METTLIQVQKALISYLPHYPESGHNGETLRRLAVDYLEDIQADGMSSLEFDPAVAIHPHPALFSALRSWLSAALLIYRRGQKRRLSLHFV